MRDSFFEKYKTSEVTNTRRVINTPAPFTRSNFFYIQEAGYLKSLKPHLSRRSGLQSYLFLVILSGSGEVAYRDITANARASRGTSLSLKKTSADAGRRSTGSGRRAGSLITVPASPGDCFFLDCRGEYTHISSEDDPWELMWIHFYGPQADAYYTYFREQQSWHFHTSHLAELTAAIQSVIRFHEEPSDDTDLLTAQQTVNILTLICTETDKSGTAGSALSNKLKDILHYLDAHYTENISLDRLAEQFFISKYYLSREFKKEYGTTIVQYLLTKKITNAKELLRYSDSSIEEVARLCGIDDASYFNKIFKKMEGCTASEYRKRW